MKKLYFLLASITLGFFLQQSNAQSHMPLAQPNYFNVKSLGWNLAPTSLPEGAKIAVLDGDPSKEGPFTLRLDLPANYRVAAHTHPGLEHVTVIEGTFYVGAGTEFNTTDVTALKRGGFITLQPGHPHFAYTKTKAVIQLHGNGPWDIHYLNTADDPRKMKE